MTIFSGFFGKIPNRGDFVRNGLPPDFVAALDDWWQHVLPASRQIIGEGWVDAWMEAPLWRFALAPGCCGAGAAVGLWLPSTDKAGRLFPLTIAAVAPRWRELASFGDFLDAAEQIGLSALERDIAPEDLTAAIAKAAVAGSSVIDEPATGATVWWTDGSPLVRPTRKRFQGMPTAGSFAEMLKDKEELLF